MGRQQLCYLAYFWPFVKKIPNSCRARRQMDGWHLQIVFFWWRNWGTKWLFVFPDLLKPWNTDFEMTVHTYLLSPPVCHRNELPADGTASARGRLEGRPAEEPRFCVCHRWPTGGASQSVPLQPATRKWQLFASSCLIKPQTENASSLLAWHLWILSSFYN